MTPEQTRAQVVEVAEQLVAALDLPISDAFFQHSPCKDNGGGPYRGQVTISYPKAESFEVADAEVDQMMETLSALGWDRNAEGFRTHSRVIRKGGVVVVFQPQSASTRTRMIRILGECRDVTTTWGNHGGHEPLTFD